MNTLINVCILKQKIYIVKNKSFQNTGIAAIHAVAAIVAAIAGVATLSADNLAGRPVPRSAGRSAGCSLEFLARRLAMRLAGRSVE